MGQSYEYSFKIDKPKCSGELHVCFWVKSNCWNWNISAYLWSTLLWQTSSIKGTTQWYTNKMRQFNPVHKRYEDYFNFSSSNLKHVTLVLLLLKAIQIALLFLFLSTSAGFAVGSVDGRVALEISDSSSSKDIGSVLDYNFHTSKKENSLWQKKMKEILAIWGESPPKDSPSVHFLLPHLPIHILTILTKHGFTYWPSQFLLLAMQLLPIPLTFSCCLFSQ